MRWKGRREQDERIEGKRRERRKAKEWGRIEGRGRIVGRGERGRWGRKHTLFFRINCFDRSSSERFPALSLVGVGGGGLDGEHGVQEEHPLVSPAREVSVVRHLEPLNVC